MISKEDRELRDKFIPIAIIEHHNLSCSPTLSTYDLASGLGKIWTNLAPKIGEQYFSFDSKNILELNSEIAGTFNGSASDFRKQETWENMIEEIFECGPFEDDPSHISSWVFSALYWDHLDNFGISTAWLYINAIRLQFGFPEVTVSLDNLGYFLNQLSGSGPPLYDGQTLYLERYEK